MLPSLLMQTQGHCNDNIIFISTLHLVSVAGGAGVREGGHIPAGAAAQWRLQGAR